MKHTASIIILIMVCTLGFAGDRDLTLDEIYSPENKVRFSGEDLPRLKWEPSGETLIKSGKFKDELFVRIDAVSGRETILVDKETLLASLASQPGFNETEAEKALKKAEYQLSPCTEGLLINLSGDLFFYEMADAKLTRLTSGKPKDKVMSFSPDSKRVSWVREGDIYVQDLTSGREKRLTTREGEKIQNGYLDWVYQEELYGRGDFKAYWWSPDSRAIAFLQLDVSDVPVNTIVDQRSVHPEIEKQLYPHPGDPNARARLGVVDVEDGSLRWMDLTIFQNQDFLIVMVNWTPDSRRLTAQVQDRAQTWLELISFDPASGEELVLLKETSPAWVDRIDKPFWLADGTFLWLSDRSGFRGIYHYSGEGELLKRVTSDEQHVKELHTVNETEGWAFFNTPGDMVTERHVCRINLDGSGLKRMTTRAGVHRAEFNRQGSMFLDTWSDINTPSRISLKNSEGETIREVMENRVGVLEEYRLSRPEFVKVKARDGLVLEGLIIKPPDFDKARKYPVLMYTYGGPGSQSVLNRWGGTTYMWHQYLASRGYIIWVFDDRIASGKGARSAWEGYKNLGPVALKDWEDGLDWLCSHPWADKERIGIWGWSYGGYATTFALTHSRYFKIGIAGAPVTDWRFYDSIYTERYMGIPADNPEAYKRTSPAEAAKDLHGRLLLIHGAIDDNVQVRNSIMFMDKLQKAGIQFEYMTYPGSRHGVRDKHQVRQMREMMTRFILDNL